MICEIKWDGATGCYIGADRAQDMFFVRMQDSPSDRMHVLVNLKKIITARLRIDRGQANATQHQ